MIETNIYIATSIRRPGRDWGAYVYLVEGRNSKESRAKDGTGHLLNTTFNQLTVVALSNALGRYHKKSRIKVYTDNQLLINSIEKDWIRKWKEDGWKNAKGQQITDYPIWNKLLIEVAGHELEFVQQMDSKHEEDLQKLLEEEIRNRCI